MPKTPNKSPLNDKQSSLAVLQVRRSKDFFKKLNSKRRVKLKKIYRAVMSYEGEKLADWSSTLKVNFANQIESIVTARLTSRNPRFIVSLRQFSDKLIER